MSMWYLYRSRFVCRTVPPQFRLRDIIWVIALCQWVSEFRRRWVSEFRRRWVSELRRRKANQDLFLLYPPLLINWTNLYFRDCTKQFAISQTLVRRQEKEADSLRLVYYRIFYRIRSYTIHWREIQSEDYKFRLETHRWLWFGSSSLFDRRRSLPGNGKDLRP